MSVLGTTQMRRRPSERAKATNPCCLIFPKRVSFLTALTFAELFTHFVHHFCFCHKFMNTAILQNRDTAISYNRCVLEEHETHESMLCWAALSDSLIFFLEATPICVCICTLLYVVRTTGETFTLCTLLTAYREGGPHND